MNHNTIPLEIYSLHLSTINNIKFSKREIDIVACILSGRSTKGIARFLSIAPKTAEVHIYNVMKKLGCNSRDNVITLIQNSDKFLIVKQYYLNLLTYVVFEESLKEIAQLIGDKRPTCFIVSDQEQQNQSFLLQQLKSNLDLVGLKIIVEIRKKNEPIFNLTQKTKTEDFLIFYTLLNEEDCKNISKVTQRGSKPFCLVLENEEEKNKNNLKKLDDVQCITLTDYYSSIFEILQKFFPEIKIQEVVKKFEKQHSFTQESSQPNQTQKEHVLGVEKSSEFLKAPLLNYRKWGILISSVLILGSLSIGVLNYTRLKEEKPIESVARSDLNLPSENVLLNRPELLSKIEEKLTGKPGIQTVALVGMGGVGKTTLTRQFARQQNASVVWEINAETNQSLQSSFEDLAISLAKISEDRKILREIQETKDEKERETRLLSFVKERLRPLSNWLLIYDNVEKFSDIQKYFPYDPNTWGAGKVLITTRNNNIQNDSHVNYVLQIGELDSNQKLALFSKILGNEKLEQLTKVKNEQTRQFLEKIPPFPLDISVAAYYLKATNVPYERYVGYIHQNNQDFEKTQEKILKEASDYSKTRYSIITVSLQNLLNKNKEFADLLLLISLVDSQSIPRDLLVKYKNDIIVDDFIYHLKKYSLIMKSSPNDSKNYTFSIHRSTQNIILNYFVKSLNLTKQREHIKSIVKIFENYATPIIAEQNSLQLRYLVKHYESLLTHSDLLSDTNKLTINAELGYIYCSLANDKKYQFFLAETLELLNKKKFEDSWALARTFSYLGILYWSIGEFKKSKDFLENSLKFYKKDLKEDLNGIALTFAYLGMLYYDMGLYDKTLRSLEKSLIFYKKCASENNFGLAFALMQIANEHRRLGNYEKAKNYIEDSISIYNNLLTKDHPEIGWALAMLGWIYEDLGEYEKAKDLHEQTFMIYKKNYPENSLSVGWAMRNLGGVYCNLRDFTKAQNFLEKSLKIFSNLLGDNNIKTKWVLMELGKAYRRMGKTEKAKNIFEDCLIAYERIYGSDSIDVSSVLMNLGKVYLLEGHLDVAEKFLNKAFQIIGLKAPHKSFFCLETLSEIAQNKSKIAALQGDKSKSKIYELKAVDFLKKALKVVKTYFPKDSPHIIRIQNKLETLEEKLKHIHYPQELPKTN